MDLINKARLGAALQDTVKNIKGHHLGYAEYDALWIELQRMRGNVAIKNKFFGVRGAEWIYYPGLTTIGKQKSSR